MPHAHRSKLEAAELTAFLSARPRAVRHLVLDLRRLVRRCAPGAAEAIRFGSLCYFKPGQPFGAIGGNICLIEAGPRGVRLSFIHGTLLPDPCGLLQGTAKAKRFVSFRSAADLHRVGVRDLVHAAACRAGL